MSFKVSEIKLFVDSQDGEIEDDYIALDSCGGIYVGNENSSSSHYLCSKKNLKKFIDCITTLSKIMKENTGNN